MLKISNIDIGERIKTSFTKKQTEKIGTELGIDWDLYDIDEFHMGMNVELEHGTVDPQTNVTDDDPIKTAQIALIHLKERKNYYTLLKEMEKKA